MSGTPRNDTKDFPVLFLLGIGWFFNATLGFLDVFSAFAAHLGYLLVNFSHYYLNIWVFSHSEKTNGKN